MANEKERKGTIFQQLNAMFNLDGFGFQDDKQSSISQAAPSSLEPKENSKIIIKGNSPEEIHRKGLELQQKFELQNKFIRTTDRGFQKALQYEAARLPAYIDYEGMEYYPIISSALDLFMEEATTIGLDGNMLSIYSSKERIKMLLEEFFYNIVNVNVNLPFWTRNTVKYGDNFVHLYGERKKGITHVRQLVNYEIERFERIQNGRSTVKFKERMTGDEFNIFEIAHFRLLGDDKYLPYGSCLLSDTCIKTNKGIKEIKDIVNGDIVYSFDVETQKLVTSNVLDVVCNGERDILNISTQHSYLNATSNHKILVYDYLDNEFKYKLVADLNIGDGLIIYKSPENEQVTSSDIKNRKTDDFIVEKIKSITPNGTGMVYDIYVDNENHNFLANNIVVHNSVLNKVRRVFRQLVMAEDAMLTYRIIRAGEKKVFKIDVGNIDEDDIEAYIYKVATKFKKVSQINPNNGQIDYRFNILGNDEDYYIPVRNANTQTGIDTLPGASNLDAIQDIEYLRDNLFIGLGIPKPFLSFQDAAGAGKNMAQYDIRFAKKINRIQQAMIQELNKMAMIHLYLLGYTGEDLNNFTLTLTNPSTQQELLKSELMRDKAQTYAELTRGDGGIAALSHTAAKRTIFNMTDKEIVDDLKQQKMEKVIMQELQDSPVIIKKTGLFADIDKKFGEPVEGLPLTGGTGGNLSPQVTGASISNTANSSTPRIGEEPPLNAENLTISEQKRMTDENFDQYVENMVYGSAKESNLRNKIKNKAIIQENNTIVNKLNINVEKMVNEIDMLLDKNKTINLQQNFDDNPNIDIENIEEIDLK